MVNAIDPTGEQCLENELGSLGECGGGGGMSWGSAYPGNVIVFPGGSNTAPNITYLPHLSSLGPQSPAGQGYIGTWPHMTLMQMAQLTCNLPAQGLFLSPSPNTDAPTASRRDTQEKPSQQSRNDNTQPSTERKWGDCDEETYTPLRQAQDSACEGPTLGTQRGCDGNDALDDLVRKMNTNYACYKARIAIRDKCYSGNDNGGHQIQLSEAAKAVRNCVRLIRRKARNFPLPDEIRKL